MPKMWMDITDNKPTCSCPRCQWNKELYIEHIQGGVNKWTSN